jgi:hypothetical protein
MGNPNFPGLPASISNRILECQRPRNKGNRKNEQQHGGCPSAIPGFNLYIKFKILIIQRRLKHHPALSDFLRAFREDIKKQGVDAANAQIFPPKRRQKDVKREERVRQILGEIREDRVRLILGDPDFNQDDDGDLLKMVTLLGIIVSFEK